MKSEPISIAKSPTLIPWANSTEKKPAELNFSQFLGQAIKEIGSLQQVADQAALKTATGEIEEIHQAVIAAEKANLSMQFALQIRSKVIDAYQEIMRMPV